MIITDPFVIAVVDDDLAVLEPLVSQLKSAGYSVSRFGAAQRLLDSTYIAELDCVISTIGMPGMDGIALQAALYRLRTEVPVILITGRDDSGERPVRGGIIGNCFYSPLTSRSFWTRLPRVSSGVPSSRARAAG